MTQYMLSVHHDPEDPGADMTPEDMQAAFTAVDAFNAKLQDAGAWVFGGGLQPHDSATMVRAQEGETLITDGPFAETKEYLGGFWVIEAPDLDAALTWAARCPGASHGTVEVRPIWAMK